MNRRSLMIAGALAPALATPPHLARAQGRYPDRPVSIIVGFGPGGSVDIVARHLGDFARQKLGANCVVENRPGAGATLAVQRTAQARPDGHTLTIVTNSPYTVFPHLQRAPYDVLADFTYIGQILVTPCPAYVLSVSPFATWQDLIRKAKAEPESLRWTTSAIRGTAHIATEAALRQEGVQAIYVPFTGIADAITSLLNGTIDMIVASGFGPLLQDSRIRLLAEIGQERLPGLEAIPTFKELGYPLAASTWFGLGGPAGLPPDIAAVWETLLREALATEGLRTLLQRYGAVPSFLPGVAFSERVVAEYHECGSVIRQLGFDR